MFPSPRTEAGSPASGGTRRGAGSFHRHGEPGGDGRAEDLQGGSGAPGRQLQGRDAFRRGEGVRVGGVQLEGKAGAGADRELRGGVPEQDPGGGDARIRQVERSAAPLRPGTTSWRITDRAARVSRRGDGVRPTRPHPTGTSRARGPPGCIELRGRSLRRSGVLALVGVEARLLLAIPARVHVAPSAGAAPAGVEEGGQTGR